MYFRNYTGTVSHVLCREVYYIVFSLCTVVHLLRDHPQGSVKGAWESLLSEISLYISKTTPL